MGRFIKGDFENSSCGACATNARSLIWPSNCHGLREKMRSFLSYGEGPRKMMDGQATPQPETILLAENEEFIRTCICQALRSEGYAVIEAGNGRQALRTEAQYHGKIDLLLTRVNLPGLSGWELAELIKLDHPEIKTLYISDHVNREVWPRSRRAAVLEKPVSSIVLREAVHSPLSEQPRSIPSFEILPKAEARLGWQRFDDDHR